VTSSRLRLGRRRMHIDFNLCFNIRRRLIATQLVHEYLL
jgi:hypothetical protein